MIGNILRQRYKIVKQLDVGGFGKTYLADDLDIPVTPKSVCVVKKLHPTIIDPEIIRLFEQEAEILYKLGQNHDQIPKLYAYFENDEELYLIQEFIDGYDLRQEISPGKKLSEGDVIQLLRDVLEILVYVHENKVIHRDIKPANIMRRKDGKLILIDFGVVKQINTTIAIKSGSTSQTIGIGTYDYMPVEQSYGKPKLSSDIYALGMTAIEALISVPLNNLSEDEDTGEIIWNNLAQVSNNLEQFINKMVRFDYRQRYKNAREALEELNQVFLSVEQQNTKPVTHPITPHKSSKNWFQEKITQFFSGSKSKDWFNEGNTLHELQKYEEAIASFDKAIAIKPDYYEAWHNRGVALSELQRYEEAIASYDKAIVIKPDYHETWDGRGFALGQSKKYMEAIASWNKVIAIKPDHHEAWANRGATLERLQKYTEAIASYDKAIAIKPDYHLAWHGRGFALGELQRYEEAIASYDKAIAIKADKDEAWYNRGVALGELQRYEEAIASYDKAIVIKPDFYKAWHNRGIALQNLQRYEDTKKH